MAEVAADRSPQDWAAALAAMAPEADVDMLGVAAMDPAWLCEGAETAFSRVIVLGVQHDYDRIATAPAPTAGAEVIVQYGRALAGAPRLAAWLRAQGWDAEPQTGPMTGKLALIPAALALACGFGEAGKHGSIINPQFGSSFRLAAVLTDAPIPATPARAFGLDGFCEACRVCKDACPPEAISPQGQILRGVTKSSVDFDRCLPFFNQHMGCSTCIAVCPWSRPGVGLSLAGKLVRRAERRSEG